MDAYDTEWRAGPGTPNETLNPSTWTPGGRDAGRHLTMAVLPPVDLETTLTALDRCVSLYWPRAPIRAGLLSELDRVLVIGWIWQQLGYDLSRVAQRYRTLVASAGKLRRLIAGMGQRVDARRFCTATLTAFEALDRCEDHMADVLRQRALDCARVRQEARRQPVPEVLLLAAPVPPEVDQPVVVITSPVVRLTPVWPNPIVGPMQLIAVQYLARIRAEGTAMTLAELKSARRLRTLVNVRQEIMWLISTLLHKSLPDIGKFFGKRDHTTVLHGIRRVNRQMAVAPTYAERMADALTAMRQAVDDWQAERVDHPLLAPLPEGPDIPVQPA